MEAERKSARSVPFRTLLPSPPLRKTQTRRKQTIEEMTEMKWNEEKTQNCNEMWRTTINMCLKRRCLHHLQRDDTNASSQTSQQRVRLAAGFLCAAVAVVFYVLLLLLLFGTNLLLCVCVCVCVGFACCFVVGLLQLEKSVRELKHFAWIRSIIDHTVHIHSTT